MGSYDRKNYSKEIKESKEKEKIRRKEKKIK